MELRDESIEAALGRMGDQAEQDSGQRVLAGVQRARGRARARRLAGLGAAAALAAAAAVTWAPGVLGGDSPGRTAQAGNQTASQSIQNGTQFIVTPGTPCQGAVHGSPSSVARNSLTKVFASDSSISTATDAWACGETPVFMFGNIQVSFEPGWDGVDAPSKLADLAADYGGTVTTIGGLPAWVSPSSATSANNEVLMIRSGTAIKLLAKGNVSIASVVAKAKTLGVAGPAVNE